MESICLLERLKVQCCIIWKLRCSESTVSIQGASSLHPHSVSQGNSARGGKIVPVTLDICPPKGRTSWEEAWLGYLCGLSTLPLPPTFPEQPYRQRHLLRAGRREESLSPRIGLYRECSHCLICSPSLSEQAPVTHTRNTRSKVEAITQAVGPKLDSDVSTRFHNPSVL